MVNLLRLDNESDLSSIKDEVCFSVVVQADQKLHAYNQCIDDNDNPISLVYFYFPRIGQEFLVGVDIVDMDSFTIDYIKDILSQNKSICYNSKVLFDKSIIDYEVLYWVHNFERLEFYEFESKINWYYYTHKDLNRLNIHIPLMVLLEYCRNIRRHYNGYMNLKVTKTVKFYNYAFHEFNRIEKNGINLCMANENRIVYSQYNFFTSTGRPSNAFNNVNFAAINKKTGVRKYFTSRYENGRLVEFDYKSFHLHLLADVIGYKFPEKDVHTYLGKLYFNVEELTDDQYEQSKNITFKNLYGEVADEYKDLEFFQKINKFSEDLYDSYLKNGYVESRYSKLKIKNIHEPNKLKLLSYYTQNLETEFNIQNLKKINDFIEGRNIQLILYTYDSFLFDCMNYDGVEEDLHYIYSILEMNRFPVKVKRGSNYHNLK